jgi:hypothetical protein
MRMLSELPIHGALRRRIGLPLMWVGLLVESLLSVWRLQPLTGLALGVGSALLLPLGLALWLSGQAPAQTTSGRVLRTAWVVVGVVLALFMVYYRYQLYQAELIVRAYQTNASFR